MKDRICHKQAGETTRGGNTSVEVSSLKKVFGGTLYDSTEVTEYELEVTETKFLFLNYTYFEEYSNPKS